jgi:hypothetical protein
MQRLLEAGEPNLAAAHRDVHQRFPRPAAKKSLINAVRGTHGHWDRYLDCKDTLEQPYVAISTSNAFVDAVLKGILSAKRTVRV